MAKMKFRPEPGVSILVKPRSKVTWADFKAEYPPFSIALDGFVRGPTRYSADGPYANFNHHEGPVTTPIAILATCGQVENAVRENDIFLTFNRNSRPYAKVHINDCDQDVCLATFELRYPMAVNRPLLHLLVDIEHSLDSTAGLYVPNKSQARMMGQVAWIFDPYASVRMSGELLRMAGKDMLVILEEVHARIKSFLFGRAKRVELDRSYDLLIASDSWSLVREKGVFARMKMVEDGIRAYALIKGERDGRFHYSLGKKALFNPLSLTEIYRACNEAEGIGEDETDRWGGGTNRGGSPPERGSGLSPDELARIIRDTVGP